MSKSKPAPAKPKPLFYPFDHAPPSAEACLDAVYTAFDHYTVVSPFCRQCFEPEQERAMLLARDIRKADAKIFDMIYFEHPNCSGGPDTFWHWLPRGLELSVFDRQPYPSLVGQMVRNGLLFLPDAELDPLRRLFSRALVNWLETGDPTPLGIIDHGKYPSLVPARRKEALLEIFSALVLLRVDMATLLPGIAEMPGDDPWSILVDLLKGEFPRHDDQVYYVLENDADIAPMCEAIAALQRRARDDTFRIVDRPFLLRKWMAASETDPDLASDLADLEALYDVYHNSQTDEERAEDERLMRIGFKLDPPPSS